MGPEPPKYFFNVFSVRQWVIQVDKNIVKIDNDINVKHVCQYFVNKMLPSGRSIGKTKRHDVPFKGTPVGPKGGFPFVTFIDVDQMVGMF